IANDEGTGLSQQTVQVGPFRELKTRSTSLADAAAYYPFFTVGDSKFTGRGDPERLNAVPVSSNFFELLGVQPQLGRRFTAEEGVFPYGRPGVVLLSDAVWRRRFAADPAIVGRAITLNDKPVVVVGVLPATFEFGPVFAPGTRIDLFVPFP